MSHLSNQVRKVLKATELEFKELSLNVLLTAFFAKMKSEEIDASITKEVPGVAKHFANKLAAGKFVFFTDPGDSRNYYVIANGHDLVAVFHSLSPAFDMYTAVASSPRALENLGIESTNFNDKKLIDKIFRFKNEDGLSVEIPEPEVTGGDVSAHHHDWFRAVPQVKEEEQNDAPKPAAAHPVKVKPAKPVTRSIERSGQPIDVPVVVSQERMKELAGSARSDSQIGQALVSASQQGGRGGRSQRDHDRREQRDRRHDQEEGTHNA